MKAVGDLPRLRSPSAGSLGIDATQPLLNAKYLAVQGDRVKKQVTRRV